MSAWAGVYAAHGEALDLSDYVRCVGSTFGQFDPMAELERRLERALEWEPLLAAKDAAIRDLATGDCRRCRGCGSCWRKRRRWVSRVRWRPVLRLTGCGRGCRRLGLSELFQVIWTRDRVREAKPSPELFLGATAELGLPPGRCLVLEDSQNGLRAAQSAGIPCIIVPSPVTRGSDFTGARRVLPVAGRSERGRTVGLRDRTQLSVFENSFFSRNENRFLPRRGNPLHFSFAVRSGPVDFPGPDFS